MSDQDIQVLTEEEFWVLFATGQPYFVRFARRLISDVMIAEDLVTEAALSVVRIIRNGGGPTKKTFISYLRVAIRNASIDHLRSASNEIAADNIGEIIEHQQETDHEVLSATTWDNEIALRAFQALSKKDQTLLMLTEVQGQSLSDVAKSQGMSVQSVAAASFRARDALRTSYLVSTVDENESCGDLKINYLAAYARGKSPELRRLRIEKHLSSCDLCPKQLKKMQSLRLPTLAILGLVTSGVALGYGVDAKPASAITNADIVRETASVERETLRRRLGLLSGIILIFFVLVWLAALYVNNTTQTAPEGTGATVEANEDGNKDTLAGVASQDPELPGLPEPPRNTKDSEADASVLPDDSVPVSPQVGQQNRTEPTAPPTTSPDLPPGVRTVKWDSKPVAYKQGGKSVQTLLRVEFDGQAKASDYVVEVVPPSGVTVAKASAGCAVQGERVLCVPISTMLGLQGFNFQFFYNLESDADLPQATVKIRN